MSTSREGHCHGDRRVRNAEHPDPPGAAAKAGNQGSVRVNTVSGSSDAAGSVVAACEQLLVAGDITEAKQTLLSLEAVTPDNEQEWKRLRSLCVRLKDRTRAQVYTERFLRVHPENAAAQLVCARNFLPNRLDWDRVRAALAAALRNPGADAGFWAEVAQIQLTIGETRAACVSARRAVALNLTDLDTREFLISTLSASRRKNELRKECAAFARCLVEANHERPLRWAKLARIAAGAGSMRQARTYIDVAEGYCTKVNPGAQFELIRALILTRQARRALRFLESYLENNNPDKEQWTTILNLAMSRRYHEIALMAIGRLKAFPYQDPEYLYRLSLKEKTALKSGGIDLKGIVSRFIRRGRWRAR